jgi:dipeptidyl aminopeptidase/acylaminoacyl peptidase
MSESQTAPYGSWKSPITSDMIVEGTVGLNEPCLDGDDVYWIEMRPGEGGRYVVVRRTPDGEVVDVTPPDFNSRTRVHEYGGGHYVVADGVVVASNYADQRLYKMRPGEDAVALTEAVDLRYADAVFDRPRNRLICVREDHTGSDREAVNAVVAVNLESGDQAVLVSGRDFYASPRLSPDGRELAWVEWDHPNMPWDSTELFVAAVGDGGVLGEPEKVAGGPGESVIDPVWSPDGALYFVSDRTDWWNIYRRCDGGVEPVCPMDAEFAAPHWVFRRTAYAFAGPGRIVCAYTQSGLWRLASVDTATGELTLIDAPYTDISYVSADATHAVFRAASPTSGSAVVRLDLASSEAEVLRKGGDTRVDPGYLTEPEPIEFPTTGGRTAHAVFYMPENKDFAAPEGERPPLLVVIHGGPTSACSTGLSLSIQYWTSRGFGVVDVNYGGSTGYGRKYRERLQGQWGIVDVDDCCNAAKYLVERGDADCERLAIRGGSAGGYTTLATLAFRDVFGAGASYYGVSDAEALAVETHKFESRYLDGLIAPYPEGKEVYHERSAMYHLDGLDRPLILFQGLEDKVVPPNQSEMVYDALKAKGVPVAYVAYEGEQHGFRIAKNIKHALDTELYFYSRVFGFETAEPIEPVQIENLS